MQAEEKNFVRQRITKLLSEGLKTQIEPFPETHKEFGELLEQLRRIAAHDLESKLVMAGFKDQPYESDEMRCLECMFFDIDRKWCDLPELSLPVEPDWYCRLWRI